LVHAAVNTTCSLVKAVVRAAVSVHTGTAVGAACHGTLTTAGALGPAALAATTE
jgi:hypothetical protein